ncbi:hypothetical protein LTR08_007756 [Meristemomyces frigidus]|nr:hypothetical protein LTR08_007756 [Meristemomyces frigidus]
MAKLSADASTARTTRSQSRETSQQPADTNDAAGYKKRGRKPKADLATVAEQTANEDEEQLQADALAADQEAAAAAAEAQRQRQSLPDLVNMQQLTSANAISNLKARKRLSGIVAPPQTAPEATMALDPRLTQGQQAGAAYDDGFVEPEADHDGVREPTPQERATSTLKHLSGHLQGFQDQQKQNAKRANSRLFVERQENAQRVDFDESQPLQPYGADQGADYQHGGFPDRSSAPGPYHVAGSSKKRAHVDDDGDRMQDFDPTQDQGFQTDMRDTTAADERRRVAQTNIPQRPRAQPTGRTDTVDYEIPGRPSASGYSRKNPGSSLPGTIAHLDPNDDSLPRSQRYQRAKNLAKLGRVVALQNRPTQVRTPWSPDEEETLIGLIEDHGGEGVSYAMLKKWDAEEDSVLARRSAEDLRFKARNMKLTYLLGRAELPDHFEHVILDKKAMDKLRARNIPYVQQRVRGAVDADDEAPGA